MSILEVINPATTDFPKRWYFHPFMMLWRGEIIEPPPGCTPCIHSEVLDYSMNYFERVSWFGKMKREFNLTAY